jgi:hypothetical protein
MAPEDEISEVSGTRMPQEVKRQDRPIRPVPEEPDQERRDSQDEEKKKHHGGKDPNRGRKLDVDA